MLADNQSIGYIGLTAVKDSRATYGKAPRFAERIKVGSDWEDGTPLPNIHDAELRDCGVSMGKQKIPKQQFWIMMRFKDGKKYKLSLNFSGISRSLMNCLFNLTPEVVKGGVKLDLSLYVSKTSGNPAMGVLINGERANWKYTKEDVPESEPYTDPADGSTKYNHTMKNSFFWKKVETDLAPLFANSNNVGEVYSEAMMTPSGLSPEVVVTGSSSKESEPPMPNDDDLPF